jgi:hypothetical protein
MSRLVPRDTINGNPDDLEKGQHELNAEMRDAGFDTSALSKVLPALDSEKP